MREGGRVQLDFAELEHRADVNGGADGGKTRELAVDRVPPHGEEHTPEHEHEPADQAQSEGGAFLCYDTKFLLRHDDA